MADTQLRPEEAPTAVALRFAGSSRSRLHVRAAGSLTPCSKGNITGMVNLRPYLPPHRSDDAPVPRMPRSLAAATAAVFAAGAGLRHQRTLHPRGASFRGVLVPHADGGLPRPDALAPGRDWPVLVRLSKGAGLPPGWPDVLGLAVRVLDAYGEGRHQDLLLSTSASPPVLRNLVVPAVGFDRAVYSSITRFDSRGRRVLLGATAARQRAPLTMDRLRQALPGLRFTLLIAAPFGRWEQVAHIDLAERLTDEESAALDFDPWNTSEQLRPVGLLNQLRAPAYAGSRRGRRAAGGEQRVAV